MKRRQVYDEGCICGHGPYAHVWHGGVARLLHLSTKCSRCECWEFRRTPPRDLTESGSPMGGGSDA